MVLGRKKLNLRKTSGTANAVTVTRRFEHVAEEVFDPWLDTAKAGRFLFATPGGEITTVEINAIPAGRFRIVERRAGEDVEHVGEYFEIHRPSRLAFTFVVPKYTPVSSRVSIEIEPTKTGCELKLTHVGVPEAEVAQAEAGWNAVLDGLTRVLD